MNVIFQMLNPSNTLTVNRLLAHAIGLSEAVIYAALISKCSYYERNGMLDDGGFIEMAEVGGDMNGRLSIELVTGKIIDGAQQAVGCYDFIVPIEFDEDRFGRDTLVHLTEFELDGDRLLAVTIGDKENYNFTGFFTANGDDFPKCLGSAWGETYSKVVGNKLIEYLKDGDKNIYEYSNGSLTAVKEYDFDE